MEKVPVSGKGILQLPFSLREKYGFLDSGLTLLIEQPEGILLKKLEPTFFDGFHGKYADDLPMRAELAGWNETEIQADEVRIKALP